MADGFLTRTIARIRLFIDEPALKAKYSDASLIDFIEASWGRVLTELTRNSQRPVVVRHSITLSSSKVSYVLPPSVKTILQIAKINSTTGLPEYVYEPYSRSNPAGGVILFEGNVLRLNPNWQGSNETVQIDYIPGGNMHLHEGTAGTITNDTSTDEVTIVLDATPTTGTLENRPHGLEGSILRILSASTNNYVQERIIIEHDVATGTVTCAPAFEAALLPGGATVTYEIAPLYPASEDMVVALDVARTIMTMEGDKDRYYFLEKRYAEEMRRLRLDENSIELIRGRVYQGDTRDNSRFVSPMFGW